MSDRLEELGQGLCNRLGQLLRFPRLYWLSSGYIEGAYDEIVVMLCAIQLELSYDEAIELYWTEKWRFLHEIDERSNAMIFLCQTQPYTEPLGAGDDETVRTFAERGLALARDRLGLTFAFPPTK